MKVTDVKLFIVSQGFDLNYGPPGFSSNFAWIKVYTDAGIDGIGEPFHSLEKPIAGSLAKYRRWLIGRDPTRVLHNWEAMYRGQRYPLGTAELAALSGVEQALWDIAGKACGLPVYKMLGGPCRDRIRAYHSGAWSQMPALAGLSVPQQAKAIVDEGWTAIKFPVPQADMQMEPPHAVWQLSPKSAHRELEEKVERTRQIREAVGADVDICVDYGAQQFSPTPGIKLAKALEPYKPLFLEEAALSENPDLLLEVKAQTSIPIAAGERVVHRDLFKEIIEKRAVDIIQLEPTACGGIMETVKRAAMAEIYHIMLAPHHASGPVALTTAVHIDAVVPNFLIQEMGTDLTMPRLKDLFDELPVIDNGYIQLPTKPGLGIELNEEAVHDYPPSEWDRPVVIQADGSAGLGA